MAMGIGDGEVDLGESSSKWGLGRSFEVVCDERNAWEEAWHAKR